MSAVVAEQKIQGLEHWTHAQVKSAIRKYIEDIVSANQLDFKIVDMEIVGSRVRGTATPESDLDVVVQYTGELKEDRAQDIFNYERLRLDNIEVDIAPIREPLKNWLERHRGYVKMHYDDIPYPEVIEEIKKIPDVNDPRRINYWVQKGNRWIYIEGWCDKCLLGTGFPPMEKGGTFDKVMYMEDMTPKILEAKAKEKGLKLLRGGFAETEDKENLYGVTWGIFEAAKPAAQGILTINYTGYRGAGVSKTLPPDHEIITKTLNEMRREATLKIDGKIIGKVEWIGKRTGLPYGRRWNWWYDSEEVNKLRSEKEHGKRMNKTVYIAGLPEAAKENPARIAELENTLKEGGYGVAGRQATLGGTYMPPAGGKEPWQMTYGEFFPHVGSEYTSGERFGIPTKNRVPIIPETGYLEKGATPEERVHRAVVRKALREKKPVPHEVLAEYPDLARIYGKTGNHLRVKEPWQMTREEFKKTAEPLQDRKDFIKAWLRDNEGIPNLMKPGINYIPQRNYAMLVFGNQSGQAIGVISMYKDAVEHIAVSDRYKGRGIATQLLEESRKYGVRRVIGKVSPEASGIVHKFTVKTAFLEGKPVPPEVLREYPDLMAKVEKQRWRRA